MKFALTLLTLVVSSMWQCAMAAPPYSLDGLLVRSETVFLGKVTKQEGRKIDLTVSKRLRGEKSKRFTFELVNQSADAKLDAGASYFVISQGDEHFGMPKPVATIGQGIIGQASYCGWILFPLKTEKKLSTVPGISSSTTRGVLTLKEAEIVVKQTPYVTNRLNR